MTRATIKMKVLLLARLDEVIVDTEKLEKFYWPSTLTVKLEEMRELRTQIQRLDTLGEIADLLTSEGLFHTLTEATH